MSIWFCVMHLLDTLIQQHAWVWMGLNQTWRAPIHRLNHPIFGGKSAGTQSCKGVELRLIERFFFPQTCWGFTEHRQGLSSKLFRMERGWQMSAEVRWRRLMPTSRQVCQNQQQPPSCRNLGEISWICRSLQAWCSCLLPISALEWEPWMVLGGLRLDYHIGRLQKGFGQRPLLQ